MLLPYRSNVMRCLRKRTTGFVYCGTRGADWRVDNADTALLAWRWDNLRTILMGKLTFIVGRFVGAQVTSATRPDRETTDHPRKSRDDVGVMGRPDLIDAD